MFAALEKYDVRKNRIGGWAEQQLPEELGTVHAFASYRASRSPSKQPEFFEGVDGLVCVCGRRIKVRLAVAFDVEDPDACVDCVELVNSGVNRNHDYWYHAPSRCGDLVMVDGVTYTCSRRFPHGRDSHRSNNGATWESGPNDWTPPPDGFV